MFCRNFRVYWLTTVIAKSSSAEGIRCGAAARDGVKKEGLRMAGIGYHEIVADHTTPSELRALVEKLVPALFSIAIRVNLRSYEIGLIRATGLAGWCHH